MLGAATIRLAVHADAPAIARLSRAHIEQGLPWRWRTERVLRALRDPDTNVVAVGPTGHPHAFAIMRYADDGDAHLLLLAVAPRWRRRGVASALLEWLEAVARAAGVRRIVLEARRDNAPARDFYGAHGYHERTIARAMYSGVLDGIRFEKWLRTGDATPGSDRVRS